MGCTSNEQIKAEGKHMLDIASLSAHTMPGPNDKYYEFPNVLSASAGVVAALGVPPAPTTTTVTTTTSAPDASITTTSTTVTGPPDAAAAPAPTGPADEVAVDDLGSFAGADGTLSVTLPDGSSLLVSGLTPAIKANNYNVAVSPNEWVVRMGMPARKCPPECI
eukprot:SAG22_NODE_3736_length_1552_cov_1.273228_3_plen_164_part_01